MKFAEMTRIAHIADLHIGSYQYGIKARQDAHKASCLKLAAQIAKGEYDVVLVAGDVFDSSQPSPDDILCWNKMVAAMRPAKVIACVGNHDKVLGSESQWVDTADIHTGGSKSGGCTVFECGLRIAVFDHIRKRDIKPQLMSLDVDADIVMMHQSCCGFLPSIMRPELDEEDLKTLSGKCRYLALGDLHIHKMMKVSKTCTAAYPGNTEFLRLCDPINSFKYIHLEYDREKRSVSEIRSIEFQPVQPAQVFEFGSYDIALSKEAQYPGAFNIFRHFPEQSDEAQKFAQELQEKYRDAIFHLHRDKPPKTQLQESEDEGVSEDTDFMDLVEKERTLDERDVEIIGELWKTPTPDNVQSVLSQDLKEQKSENN